MYPCYCSRQDVRRALQAPHAGEEEPLYPGTCRPAPGASGRTAPRGGKRPPNWRFRAPKGAAIEFEDPRCIGILRGVVIEMEDPRCNGLRQGVMLKRVAIEMDDPRCKRVEVEVEDPRCRSLRMW